jgi:HSP20 family molecular chaperone IbpA
MKMKLSDSLVKNMVVTADLLNTINGGMSLPSTKMRKLEDCYELDVVAPGLSVENLKIEIHNRHLSVFHYLNYKAPNHTNEQEGAPNIVHLMPIPFDVELDSITALYEEKHLKVIMPFNELAEGYFRSVDIDTV